MNAQPMTSEVPKIIVNVAVLADHRTLLVRYRHRPDRQAGWFLPHVELASGSDPAAAARAALADQLGLAGTKLWLSHADSFVGNDGTWHLPLTYVAEVDAPDDVVRTAGDFVLEARWFLLDDLPPRRDVAHGGWALDLLADLSSRR